MLAGGVDPSWITWVADDGIGRDVRNGLNFTERGFGVRGAKGVSDRGRSAASQLRPEDTDWEHLFGTLGVRWFHTGGIFAGLSAGTADVVVAAMEAARRHGTVVSYDLNYRPSLWELDRGPGPGPRGERQDRRARRRPDRQRGGLHRRARVRRRGRVRGPDRAASRGLRRDARGRRPRPAAAAGRGGHAPRACAARAGTTGARSPGRPRTAWSGPPSATTSRSSTGSVVATASRPASSTRCWPAETSQTAVEYGAAHGALAMTTPGDTSMATLAEVEALVRGAGARVQR